jgi:hypothetical protein
LRSMGYLKHQQPAVGTVRLSWVFQSAQSLNTVSVGDVNCDLYVWEQWHGAFLSFAWSPDVTTVSRAGASPGRGSL